MFYDQSTELRKLVKPFEKSGHILVSNSISVQVHMHDQFGEFHANIRQRMYLLRTQMIFLETEFVITDLEEKWQSRDSAVFLRDKMLEELVLLVVITYAGILRFSLQFEERSLVLDFCGKLREDVSLFSYG